MKAKYEIGDKAYIFEGLVDGLPNIKKLEITGTRLIITDDQDKEIWYTAERSNDARIYFQYNENDLFPLIQDAIKEAIEYFNEIILQK